MNTLNIPLTGPFLNETAFKAASMSFLSAYHHKVGKWFRIETEETEPGMPDTVFFPHTHDWIVAQGRMIEYKISDDRGRIKFKRSQPLFYRQNMDLDIVVWAWDRRYNRAVQIEISEVIAGKSLTMWIPDKIAGTVIP